MNWAQFIDVGHKVLTIAAIVAAGAWVLYNYKKEKPHSFRLEPKITSTVLNRANEEYLLVHISLNNSGRASVSLDQKGTGLRVSYAERAPEPTSKSKRTQAIQADWQHIGTFTVFPYDELIESNELVTEKKLLRVFSEGAVAYLVELYLRAGKSLWVATSVAITSPTETAEHSSGKEGV